MNIYLYIFICKYFNINVEFFLSSFFQRVLSLIAYPKAFSVAWKWIYLIKPTMAMSRVTAMLMVWVNWLMAKKERITSVRIYMDLEKVSGQGTKINKNQQRKGFKLKCPKRLRIYGIRFGKVETKCQ